MTTTTCPACGHQFDLIFDVSGVGHCERFCPQCDEEIVFRLDWVPEVIESWVGTWQAGPAAQADEVAA